MFERWMVSIDCIHTSNTAKHQARLTFKFCHQFVHTSLLNVGVIDPENHFDLEDVLPFVFYLMKRYKTIDGTNQFNYMMWPCNIEHVHEGMYNHDSKISQESCWPKIYAVAISVFNSSTSWARIHLITSCFPNMKCSPSYSVRFAFSDAKTSSEKVLIASKSSDEPSSVLTISCFLLFTVMYCKPSLPMVCQDAKYLQFFEPLIVLLPEDLPTPDGFDFCGCLSSCSRKTK